MARALVVGTAVTVRQIQWSLSAAPEAPQVVACVPVGGGAAAAAGWPVPPVGDLETLGQLAGDYDIVLVCLPAAMTEVRQRVAASLEAVDRPVRWLPTLTDLLDGRSSAGQPGAVDLARLIDRTPRPLDDAAIADTLVDRVVMITGAGGSIGSEIARRVATYRPRRLVLVERSENALFEIDREIARTHPTLARTAVLHDVTHAARTRQVVATHRPAVIYHAAAHKHVPMMEDHPAEAVENNFYGTRSIADAFDAAGGERFVMISTDKAVNPSSVMGASKRLAELYVQHLDQRSRARFCMVRFGNVLGSACSVLPIWSAQIARGEPVTVTHPDMQRYFMTIPEAAMLVLQAGAMCDGGEVFLLDMGQPVRVLDLARRFVRLMGLEPDVDVPIRITGIRPGEKLFEELAYDGEDKLPTAHDSIHVWRTAPPDAATIRQIIDTFDRLRSRTGPGGLAAPLHPWQHATPQAIVTALRASIPEMAPAAAAG